MINFKRFWRDWLTVFVPTVLILLIIYIFFIYPNEKMALSGLNEVDAIYRDNNATTFRFGIFMMVLFSGLIAQIYAVSLDAYKLKFSLPVSVPARLKSKAIRNYFAPRAIMMSTAYELVFELDTKEIKKFYVTPDKFSFVFENNRGILTYREHSKSVYVDFDVIEING